MTNIQDIQLTLEKMAELLRVGGINDWAVAFEAISSDFFGDPARGVAKILAMYGGMGSLNDLVLYKEGKTLGAGNRELDELRSNLYALCHEWIATAL